MGDTAARKAQVPQLMPSGCRCSNCTCSSSNFSRGQEDVHTLASDNQVFNSSASRIPCHTARNSGRSASCKHSILLHGGNRHIRALPSSNIMSTSTLKNQPSLLSNSQESPARAQCDKRVCLTSYFSGHNDSRLEGDHDHNRHMEVHLSSGHVECRVYRHVDQDTVVEHSSPNLRPLRQDERTGPQAGAAEAHETKTNSEKS